MKSILNKNRTAHIVIVVAIVLILISCVSVLLGFEISRKYPYKTSRVESVPAYSVTWIPDGYTLFREDTFLLGGQYEWRDQGKGRIEFYYTFNPNNAIHIGETVYSFESMPEEPETKDIFFNEVEKVIINGCPAHLYIDNIDYNYLIWVNDDGGMMSLYGNIKPEDMLFMAESINVSK